MLRAPSREAREPFRGCASGRLLPGRAGAWRGVMAQTRPWASRVPSPGPMTVGDGLLPAWAHEGKNMLKRIRIRGYKSLHDIDLELPELAVLVGPNAGGKSNLLDALRLLAKAATGVSLEEAFDPPHRGKPIEAFSFPDGGLEELRASRRLTFSIEADFRLSDSRADSVEREIQAMRGANGRGKPAARVCERDLRYRIAVEMLPDSDTLRMADERLVALNSAGRPKRNRRPFIERRGGKARLRSEERSHPDHIEKSRERTILSSRFYVPHHPHPEAVRRELEGWQFFCFEPMECMRNPNPSTDTRRVGPRGEDLAGFVRALQEHNPKRLAAINRALRLILPNTAGVEAVVNRLGDVELFLRENGIGLPAGVMSEGTLRILGLLATAGIGENPSLIGLEEPENGVHPGSIDLVADMLLGRICTGENQLVVTTHSPRLTDLVPPESLLVARMVGGQTRIDPITHWGPLVKMAYLGESFDAIKDDFRERVVPVSERVLQGDFDA